MFLAVALTAALCPSSPLWAARSELIPETTAAQHGLTRPWFTQVELDQGQGRLRDLVLYEGTLYAQTDKAVVHAIDAETGKTLWWKQVGLPQHPSMTPGAGRDLLAVVNGSRLYVLNRFNGDLLYEKELSGSPGGGAGPERQAGLRPLGYRPDRGLSPGSAGRSRARSGEGQEERGTPEEKAPCPRRNAGRTSASSRNRFRPCSANPMGTRWCSRW